MWQVELVSGNDGNEIKDSLNKLVDNSIAATRIPEIYTDDELDVIVDNIEREGVMWYPNFKSVQGRIGICATEFVSKFDGMNVYFQSEAEASELRDTIFPGSLDPIKKMIDIFSQGFDTSVATEPEQDHARYFTGLIRAMAQESTTHYDFAPHQLPGWKVAESQAQFAVVAYLQMPDNGGGLTVYNRPGEPEDDKYNQDTEEKGPKGFEEEFLDEEESLTILPNAGEMIIINSKNFHRVEKIQSQVARYSINSFMSLLDNKLYLWN
jgi:hypothetical protein